MTPNPPRDTMTSRERVLAALDRQPVDRIPYCEHLVDVEVAIKSLTRPEQLAPVTPLLGRMQQLRAAAGTGMSGAAAGELMLLMGRLDYEVSVALGRDNITFWGGAAPFRARRLPARPGASGPGRLRGRHSEDARRTWARCTSATRRKSSSPRGSSWRARATWQRAALIFLGIDPCWHSMGFETFCVSCIQDPGLVDSFPGADLGLVRCSRRGAVQVGLRLHLGCGRHRLQDTAPRLATHLPQAALAAYAQGGRQDHQAVDLPLGRQPAAHLGRPD